MFENKILLLTGGTGSFGNAVLSRFLESDLREIRIFSRDEKKQDDMRTLLKNEKLKTREKTYTAKFFSLLIFDYPTHFLVSHI